MLICGRNYKGTMSENCSECKVTDDENHRLNECSKFRSTNRYDNASKIQFDDIYTNDASKVSQVVNEIDKVWNLEYGGNKMQI